MVPNRILRMGGVWIVFVMMAVGVAFATWGGQNKDADAPSTSAFLKEYIGQNLKGQESIAQKYLAIVATSTLLSALEKNNPLCHVEAHALGRVIFRTTGNISDSVVQCSTSCSYGCFHGAMMEMFSTESDTLGGTINDATQSKFLNSLADRAMGLCDQDRVKSVVTFGECIHGIGHVATYMSKYNINDAIHSCERFGDPLKASVCSGGAFMEFMQNGSASSSVRSKSFYPCDTFPQYAERCYQFKGHWMVDAWGSVGAAIAACHTLSSDTTRLACVRGAAFALGTPERLSKKDGLSDVCGILQPDERNACISGAIANAVYKTNVYTGEVCAQMAPEFRKRCTTFHKNVVDFR